MPQERVFSSIIGGGEEMAASPAPAAAGDLVRSEARGAIILIVATDGGRALGLGRWRVRKVAAALDCTRPRPKRRKSMRLCVREAPAAAVVAARDAMLGKTPPPPPPPLMDARDRSPRHRPTACEAHRRVVSRSAGRLRRVNKVTHDSMVAPGGRVTQHVDREAELYDASSGKRRAKVERGEATGGSSISLIEGRTRTR
jgi:hypothetical protein